MMMLDSRLTIIVALISALSQVTIGHRVRCGDIDCEEHEQCMTGIQGNTFYANCTSHCEHLGHCEPHHIRDGHRCCCPDPHCMDDVRREAEKHHGIICGHTICRGHYKCMISDGGRTRTCSSSCEEEEDCDPHRVREGHRCCCHDHHCLDRIHIEPVPAHEEHLTCPHCANYPHGCDTHHKPCHPDQVCSFIREHDHHVHSDCKPKHECEDNPNAIVCCSRQACVNSYGHTTHTTQPTTTTSRATHGYHIPCPICSDLLNQNCTDRTWHCNVGRPCHIHLHNGIISTMCTSSHSSRCTINNGMSTTEEHVCCNDMDCYNQTLDRFKTLILNAKSSSSLPSTTQPMSTSTTPKHFICSECSDFSNSHCTNLMSSCSNGENCLVVMENDIISTRCIKEADCSTFKKSDLTSGGNRSSTCCSDGKCYMHALIKYQNAISMNAKSSTPIPTTTPSITTTLTTTTTTTTTTPATSTPQLIPCSQCSDFQSGKCTEPFILCKTGENCLIRIDQNVITTQCMKEADCQSTKQSDVQSGGNTSSTCCLDEKCYMSALISDLNKNQTSNVPALNQSTLPTLSTKKNQTSNVPALNQSTLPTLTTKTWLTVFNDCKDNDDPQMSCWRMDNDFKLCSSPDHIALALLKCRHYCGLCHHSTTQPIKTTQPPATMIVVG